MNMYLKIMTIFLFLNFSISAFAVEVIDKIKDESKSIIKTLTRKSLTKEETIQFISDYVIIVDDKKGDGLATYYFEENFYKKYINLEIISEDKWKFSRLGHLVIYNKNDKFIWKIQTEKKNTINIKRKWNSVGELYEFFYKNKTDFYLALEEKKINSIKVED